MPVIEIAGLALGAIPVLLEAIKAYRSTYNHMQDFKHATKQLQIVDAQFHVCSLNFLSECRQLLDLVLSNPQLSKEMMTDTQHSLWQDQTVEDQLASLLQGNAKACATIVADTITTIHAFNTRLSKLNVSPVCLSLLRPRAFLLILRQKTSSSTMQRARVSAIYMMEKSRFERDIATLRKRNADLNFLRSHFSLVDSSIRSRKGINADGEAEIQRLATVRLASRMVHDTLKTAWSCLDNTHVQHWVKLCVDSHTKSWTDSITLDMAVSSEVAQQQPYVGVC
jgi:hypothetical protein